MALIALLVEGRTEEIFLDYLLPYIQSQDRLFVSNKLPAVLENDLHENKIWLKDCRGDSSIVSYIKKELRAFIINHFDSIIIVRDYLSYDRPRTALCKGDVCHNIMNNLPEDFTNKYTNNLFINLSVEEIEAWFFLDRGIFRRIDPTLDDQFINENFKNILEINPEDIRHPSLRIKEIFKRGSSSFRYSKKECDVYAFISRLVIDNLINSTNEEHGQSFNRFLNVMLSVL